MRDVTIVSLHHIFLQITFEPVPAVWLSPLWFLVTVFAEISPNVKTVVALPVTTQDVV